MGEPRHICYTFVGEDGDVWLYSIDETGKVVQRRVANELRSAFDIDPNTLVLCEDQETGVSEGDTNLHRFVQIGRFANPYPFWKELQDFTEAEWKMLFQSVRSQLLN